MSNNLSDLNKIINFSLSSYFVFLAMILGIFLLVFIFSVNHDYKEPKCFQAIDDWYKEKGIGFSQIDFNKRWAQHLECEENLGLFPLFRKPTFSENPMERFYKEIPK